MFGVWCTVEGRLCSLLDTVGIILCTYFRHIYRALTPSGANSFTSYLVINTNGNFTKATHAQLNPHPPPTHTYLSLPPIPPFEMFTNIRPSPSTLQKSPSSSAPSKTGIMLPTSRPPKPFCGLTTTRTRLPERCSGGYRRRGWGRRRRCG